MLLDDWDNVGERHLRRELDDTSHTGSLEAGRRVLRPVDDLGRALEWLNKPGVSFNSKARRVALVRAQGAVPDNGVERGGRTSC